ncbi:MAG: hypothetical protein MZV63_50985 [Marinilabiliales bacterium]|nr:hypothetical protein [Marinilabiliales bacterium]
MKGDVIIPVRDEAFTGIDAAENKGLCQKSPLTALTSHIREMKIKGISMLRSNTLSYSGAG